MATRMKPDTWDSIPRNVKLSYVGWPDLAPRWAQDEMRRRFAAEGKNPPKGLPTEPKPDGSKVPGLVRVDPSKVPGLVRKPK
jgi:hypothetical protein